MKATLPTFNLEHLISQECLGVGIPVTFLLTAIVFSLLTLLITYWCMASIKNREQILEEEILTKLMEHVQPRPQLWQVYEIH